MVSIPLSDWWGGAHAISEMKLKEDSARERLAYASDYLVLDMRDKLQKYEQAYQRVQVARTGCEEADANKSEIEDGYNNGTEKLSDLLEAMMSALDITEERLKKEQVIPTPFGQTLQWDYYSYVKANQIVRWPHGVGAFCRKPEFFNPAVKNIGGVFCGFGFIGQHKKIVRVPEIAYTGQRAHFVVKRGQVEVRQKAGRRRAKWNAAFGSGYAVGRKELKPYTLGQQSEKKIVLVDMTGYVFQQKVVVNRGKVISYVAFYNVTCSLAGGKAVPDIGLTAVYSAAFKPVGVGRF